MQNKIPFRNASKSPNSSLRFPIKNTSQNDTANLIQNGQSRWKKVALTPA